jgi:hypothetical protein
MCVYNRSGKFHFSFTVSKTLKFLGEISWHKIRSVLLYILFASVLTWRPAQIRIQVFMCIIHGFGPVFTKIQIISLSFLRY